MKFLVFENNICGRVHRGYFLAEVMTKDGNFEVNGHNLSNNIHQEIYESF